MTELGTCGILVCSGAGLDSALSSHCVYITGDRALDSTASTSCFFFSEENSMQQFAVLFRIITLFQLFTLIIPCASIATFTVDEAGQMHMPAL